MMIYYHQFAKDVMNFQFVWVVGTIKILNHIKKEECKGESSWKHYKK